MIHLKTSPSSSKEAGERDAKAGGLGPLQKRPVGEILGVVRPGACAVEERSRGRRSGLDLLRCFKRSLPPSSESFRHRQRRLRPMQRSTIAGRNGRDEQRRPQVGRRNGAGASLSVTVLRFRPILWYPWGAGKPRTSQIASPLFNRANTGATNPDPGPKGGFGGKIRPVSFV